MRMRHDDARFAVGLGADRPCPLLALGAVLLGQALALGLHAPVDTHFGALRQLGAVDPDVGDGDPLVGQRIAALLRDVAHDRDPRVLQHLDQRVTPDHLAHIVAHGAIDPLLGIFHPARKRAAEGDGVIDSPDDVVVHRELLAVLRLDGQGLRAEIEPASIVGLGRLEKRHPQRQARLRHPSHLTEQEDELLLVLAGDDERPQALVASRHQPCEKRQQHRRGDDDPPHGCGLPSRPSGR